MGNLPHMCRVYGNKSLKVLSLTYGPDFLVPRSQAPGGPKLVRDVRTEVTFFPSWITRETHPSTVAGGPPSYRHTVKVLAHFSLRGRKQGYEAKRAIRRVYCDD